MYAPTLAGVPDGHEKWMHQQFLDAGIAVAGIDVGEAYGSPKGCKGLTALYAELTGKRGFALRPVPGSVAAGAAYGSRAGRWKIPTRWRVSPAFIRSWTCACPGLAKAAPAFELSEAELKSKLDDESINRVGGTCEAQSTHIHYTW